MKFELRWKRVFNCVLESSKQGYKFVDFCFLCQEPVAGKAEWEDHCQAHIQLNLLPSRCNPLIYRYATVSPGRYLVCMHNQNLSASKRFFGFKHQTWWEKHINTCFASYVSQACREHQILCPDSDCTECFETEQEAWYHLQDIHSYPAKLEEHDNNTIYRFVAQKETHGLPTTAVKVFPSQSSTTFTPTFSTFDSKSSMTSDTGSQPQDFSWADEMDLDKSSLSSAISDCIGNAGAVPPTSEHLKGSSIPIDPGLLDAETGTLANNTQSRQLDDTDISGMGGTEAHQGLAEDEYELDRILGKWCRRGKELVFVRWLDGSTTWEPPKDMGNDQLIKQFEREYQGFREGVQILACRMRSHKRQFRLRFDGQPRSQDSWLQERELHKDLVAEWDLHNGTIRGGDGGRRRQKAIQRRKGRVHESS